jgi:hypothetical protein
VKELGRVVQYFKIRGKILRMTYSFEHVQVNLCSHSQRACKWKQHVSQMEEEVVAQKSVAGGAMTHSGIQCVSLEGVSAQKLVAEGAMTHSEIPYVSLEGVSAQKLVEEGAMTHSEIPCVSLEGVSVPMAEAVLHFVGRENLFECAVTRSQRPL